MFTIAVWNRR